jgi:hypothetical protein
MLYSMKTGSLNGNCKLQHIKYKPEKNLRDIEKNFEKLQNRY